MTNQTYGVRSLIWEMLVVLAIVPQCPTLGADDPLAEATSLDQQAIALYQKPQAMIETAVIHIRLRHQCDSAPKCDPLLNLS